MDGGGWCEFEKPEIMGFALSMYYEQQIRGGERERDQSVSSHKYQPASVYQTSSHEIITPVQ